MTRDPVLKKWNPTLPTKVETDASDGVTGGALSQQQPDGKWHPVGFFTRAMSSGELNYGIKSKELLAVMHGLDEWRAELISLPDFEVVTDHEALKWFAQKRTLTSRQMGWSETLSEFNIC